MIYACIDEHGRLRRIASMPFPGMSGTLTSTDDEVLKGLLHCRDLQQHRDVLTPAEAGLLAVLEDAISLLIDRGVIAYARCV